MTIIDKIKESVENATGLPFYYDSPETLNMRMSGSSQKRPWVFPCAMLNIIKSGAVQDQNGILRERLTIEVLFATKSDLDFDGVQVEECEIDKMKERAFTWLLALMRSRSLRLVSLNGTNRYYATDDAIYSAYGVNITIDEAQGFSPCDLNT
jgi:hypothetical protein